MVTESPNTETEASVKNNGKTEHLIPQKDIMAIHRKLHYLPGNIGIVPKFLWEKGGKRRYRVNCYSQRKLSATMQEDQLYQSYFVVCRDVEPYPTQEEKADVLSIDVDKG